ncbi:MAG: alpha/beta fold hydrolase [Thermonemataceae bacterium]
MKNIGYIICFLGGFYAYGQKDIGGLPRQAKLDFSLRWQADQGALIREVTPDSRASKAGLQAGDILLSIDQQPLDSYTNYHKAIAPLQGEKSYSLKLQREKQVLTTRYKPAALPLEKNLRNKVIYEYLQLPNGKKLRTLITKPKTRTNRKRPAVFLVQWLSCTTTETTTGVVNGFDLLTKYFAEHPDIIFMRVEKQGVGDSEGVCAEYDLKEELLANQLALEALKKRADVDTTQIYLVGMSLGGGLSALLGEHQPIKGYIVTGACTVTWFEHMMEIERRRLSLLGETPTQINDKMRRYASFYQKYYNEKMTPGEIVKQYPKLANLWYDQPAHQYGRPARFYQQLQEINFEAAWTKVKVPTLVIYGKYDWIMSLNDHQSIVDIVNTSQANLAQLEVLPKTNHVLNIFDSPQAAFKGKGGTPSEQLIRVVDEWFKVQLAQP